MKEILENDYLKIEVKNHGAELCSLIKKSTSVEYIWEGNPQYWGRHAPVLFPIVGRLQEDTFFIGEDSFSMKQHGLARNIDFQLVKETEDTLTFELNHSETTLVHYPFPFRLRISYTLTENRLVTTYQVLNPTDSDLYFSIGAHPAFRCPLNTNEKRSDYQLVFEEKEEAATQRLDNGIRNGKTDLILDNQSRLPITNNLFEEDALVFENLNSNWVCLQKGVEEILTFDFTDFPYLGIWSKNEESPFICIEPWFGVADHIQHNQQLSKKKGIIKLTAQKNFECAFSIEIH